MRDGESFGVDAEIRRTCLMVVSRYLVRGRGEFSGAEENAPGPGEILRGRVEFFGVGMNAPGREHCSRGGGLIAA